MNRSSFVLYTLLWLVKFKDMIQIPIDVRNEFLDNVKNFCSNNDVDWGAVNSESWLCGAIGTPINVQKVIEYNKKLENERTQYRKEKSFWWRLIN